MYSQRPKSEVRLLNRLAFERRSITELNRSIIGRSVGYSKLNRTFGSFFSAKLDRFIYMGVIHIFCIKWSSLALKMNQTKKVQTKQNCVRFAKPNVPFSDVNCIG